MHPPWVQYLLQRVNYERQDWKCASAESARAAQATRRFAGSCAMGWGHTGVVGYESCADKQSPQMLSGEGDSSPFAHPFIIPDVPSQLERAKAKLNTQGSQVMEWLVMGPL